MKYSLVLIMVIITGCNGRQQLMNKKHFDIQGHRGCRGIMPENTLPAMIKAIDLSVSTLEMDVVITKDGQVTLSHEPFFNHEISTLPDGSFIAESDEQNFNIFKMDYADVCKIDVGLKPHPRFPQQQKIKAIKPLLSELMDSVEHYCHVHHIVPVQYNIEIKSTDSTDNIFHPEPALFTDIVLKIIYSKKVENRTIIQSFDNRVLQYLHYQHPEVVTALLIEGNDKRSLEQQFLDLGFIPKIYSPEFSLVDKKLLQYCHEKNMKVIPWTVNSKDEIERLQQAGVDGIITDYPDLLR